MIAFVEGNVRLVRKESVVLDVHGIGYEVFVANPMAYPKDSWQFFYTYMAVREDAVILYGFAGEDEYEIFCRLINVKGIGPKTAMKALAVMGGQEMLKAIEEENVAALKKLPGIGAKSAGQIILDLKGKVILSDSAKASQPANPVWKETREALLSLGYKPAALESLEQEMIGNTTDSVDVMLRKCLQYLAARNGV